MSPVDSAHVQAQVLLNLLADVAAGVQPTHPITMALQWRVESDGHAVELRFFVPRSPSAR